MSNQCALPLSRQTLTFVADLLRGHLKKIGSRWRKLPPGKIALIVLATLRHDHRIADMAGGNGVSASTIHRWTWEIIGRSNKNARSAAVRRGQQAFGTDHLRGADLVDLVRRDLLWSISELAHVHERPAGVAARWLDPAPAHPA